VGRDLGAEGLEARTDKVGRDLGEVANDGGHAAAGGGAARQVEGHELHVRHVGGRLEVRQRVKIQLPAQNARPVFVP